MNEKLQFISVTYLWSHGVDVKGQSGREPADPSATPGPATPFGVATPGLRNRWSTSSGCKLPARPAFWTYPRRLALEAESLGRGVKRAAYLLDDDSPYLSRPAAPSRALFTARGGHVYGAGAGLRGAARGCAGLRGAARGLAAAPTAPSVRPSRSVRSSARPP